MLRVANPSPELLAIYAAEKAAEMRRKQRKEQDRLQSLELSLRAAWNRYLEADAKYKEVYDKFHKPELVSRQARERVEMLETRLAGLLTPRGAIAAGKLEEYQDTHELLEAAKADLRKANAMTANTSQYQMIRASNVRDEAYAKYVHTRQQLERARWTYTSSESYVAAASTQPIRWQTGTPTWRS